MLLAVDEAVEDSVSLLCLFTFMGELSDEVDGFRVLCGGGGLNKGAN